MRTYRARMLQRTASVVDSTLPPPPGARITVATRLTHTAINAVLLPVVCLVAALMLYVAPYLQTATSIAHAAKSNAAACLLYLAVAGLYFVLPFVAVGAVARLGTAAAVASIGLCVTTILAAYGLVVGLGATVRLYLDSRPAVVGASTSCAGPAPLPLLRRVLLFVQEACCAWQLAGVSNVLVASGLAESTAPGLLADLEPWAFLLPNFTSDGDSGLATRYSRGIFLAGFGLLAAFLAALMVYKALELLPYPPFRARGVDIGEKTTWAMLFGVYVEFPDRAKDPQDVIRSVMDSMCLRGSSPAVRALMALMWVVFEALYTTVLFGLLAVLNCSPYALAATGARTCWRGDHRRWALAALLGVQATMGFAGVVEPFFRVILNRNSRTSECNAALRASPWFTQVERGMLLLVVLSSVYLAQHALAALALNAAAFALLAAFAWWCLGRWPGAGKHGSEESASASAGAATTAAAPLPAPSFKRRLSRLNLQATGSPLAILCSQQHDYPDTNGKQRSPQDALRKPFRSANHVRVLEARLCRYVGATWASACGLVVASLPRGRDLEAGIAWTALVLAGLAVHAGVLLFLAAPASPPSSVAPEPGNENPDGLERRFASTHDSSPLPSPAGRSGAAIPPGLETANDSLPLTSHAS